MFRKLTAIPEEIKSRLHDEVYVTSVEIAEGNSYGNIDVYNSSIWH